jgi:hypothetical protein
VKVIVQPQNGYINRIQAVASSALLARSIGAEFEVQWVPEPVAPAQSFEIFSPAFLECFSSDPVAWGLKPYFNYNPADQVVTLAGLDRGEQTFMPELKNLLESDSPVSEIWISAGGKFALGGMDSEFANSRRLYYREVLEFRTEIEREANSLAAVHGEYLGLHLRYSDRNHQAPTRRQAVRAIRAAREVTGINRVFIATDTPTELPWWQERLRRVGISTWWNSGKELSPGVSGTAEQALIDWRLLGRSRGVVYFAESSFGEEAAVTAGCETSSFALSPSAARTYFIKLREYVNAAITYPKRHF